MGYDFLMAMKMGLAAVDPLFTFWAHSYTHRYYRCGWPRRQCYGCSYIQLQLLHLLQKRERMKERERACVNYRLVCLLVGVSVCVCAAAAADVATETSHCHFVSSLQWHWNLISFLAKERTHKSSIQSNCAIYRSTFVPTLFEFRIESSSPVDFVRNLMLHCCLSQVPRISQLCARINALSYMECNSCGVYHISVCSLLYIICN